METASQPQLSKWRDFFGTASGSSDIFDIITHAIKIAASDFPSEFLLQRDRIAETLFTRKKKTSPGSGAGEVVINDTTTTTGTTSIVSGKRDDDDDVLSEEETRVDAEVLRIKREFDRSQQDQSCSVSRLCDLLKRLRGMGLSVKTLKDTGIVKSVNGVRYKHWLNNDVHVLVRELIEGWRVTMNNNNIKNPKPPSSALLVDQEQVLKRQSFGKSDGHRVKPRPSMDQEKENTTNNVMETKPKSSEKAARVVGGVSREQGLKRKPSRLDAPYDTLEASSKLRERYREAENAKRQRRVQVVDWRDLPQQCLEQTRTSTRPRVIRGR